MKSTAIKLKNLNISFLPICSEKKTPVVKWKDYQNRLPKDQEIENWFNNNAFGLALITGKISQGLQIIDIDSKYDIVGDLFGRYTQAIAQINTKIVPKLVIQKTKSGGYHFIYRCEKILKNKKLASRPTLPNEREHKDDKCRVLLETRGEGGYFLSSPTDGYEIIQGSYEDIPRLTEEEQDIIIQVACSFNDFALEPLNMKTDGLTSFDHFDEQIRPDEVLSMLGKYDWKVLGNGGKSGSYNLIRPGKNNGISATWNYVPNRLYVFTSSTVFESGKIYKPSAIYSILEHNGDYSAAALALSKMGYGDKEKHVSLTDMKGIIKVSDIRKEIDDYLRNGNEIEGFDCGIPDFHNYLRLQKGHLTIVTGIPGHGKSEFVDNMSVGMARNHKWHTVYYSPENYPHRIHLQKLLEKHCASPARHVFGSGAYEYAINFLNDHFTFIDGALDGVQLQDIMRIVAKLSATKNIDMLVIDPWNELEDMRPIGLSETEYIGRCLKQIRHFLRKMDIFGVIVAHPTKMPKKQLKTDESDGEKVMSQYAVPTLYNISGSSNWYNKTDNGIVVYRDFGKRKTTVYVQKVKYRQYGKIGHIDYSFDVNSGLYQKFVDESKMPVHHYAADLDNDEELF